jgi:DNA gyrase subunit A
MGYGKRSPLDAYRRQSRGGKGLITLRTTQRNGQVVGVFQVRDDDQLMLITNSGKVLRLQVNSIRIIGRNTQGVKLIGLSPGEKVTGVARLAEKEEKDEEEKEIPKEAKEILEKEEEKES